jgi:uncharacterized protein YjbI with pentapeptide repeats
MKGMANQEHLEILKQGADTWNEWRLRTFGGPADLSGAILDRTDLTYFDLCNVILSGADLSGADLSRTMLLNARLYWTNLSDAKLIQTDLDNSDLEGANLSRADLTYADLSGVDLTEANLSNANLNETNLSGANLSGANLSGANLTVANLSNAELSDTILINVNFSSAKGLETCKHYRPSIIDNRTLKLSANLPLKFLQGIGLSDWEIETVKLYDPKLIDPEIISEITTQIRDKRANNTTQFDTVFISYQTNDKETFVNKLYNDLQSSGVRCWYAPHDLEGGKKIHKQIEEGIHLRDRTLLVLSEASLKSPWFEHEIRTARKREREENRQILYPISLINYEKLKAWNLFDADVGKDLAAEIREYYIPDFSQKANYEQEFEKLLKSLRKNSLRRDT